jgi:hypothetical protein
VKYPGPTYRHVGFDLSAGHGWILIGDTVRRYPLAGVLAGTPGTALNTITLPAGGSRQGWTSYYDSFFLLTGSASDVGTFPQQLTEYAWPTNGTVKTVDVSKVTGSTLKTEPEGLCVYDPGGNPRLQFGITLGPPGSHSYPTYDLALLDPTPNPDAFTLGETKPGTSNTGHGILTDTAGTVRPVGTGTARAGGTVTTTVRGAKITGNVTLTGAGNLIDCEVIGQVKIQNAALVENCYIHRSTGTGEILHASAATGAIVRFCTIEGGGAGGSTPNQVVLLHRTTLERCDVSRGTDGIQVANAAGTTSTVTGVKILGNYIHDLTFYAPDPGHNANLTNMADGSTYTGPWAGQATSHNDCIQLQRANDGTQITGNYLRANWATNAGTTPLQTAQLQNACFMFNAGTNVVFSKNWLNLHDFGTARTFVGRSFAINASGTAGVGFSGSVTGNRFGRKITKGDTGLFLTVTKSGTGVTYTGNVYETVGDTLDGDPITINPHTAG